MDRRSERCGDVVSAGANGNHRFFYAHLEVDVGASLGRSEAHRVSSLTIRSCQNDSSETSRAPRDRRNARHLSPGIYASGNATHASIRGTPRPADFTRLSGSVRDAPSYGVGFQNQEGRSRSGFPILPASLLETLLAHTAILRRYFRPQLIDVNGVAVIAKRSGPPRLRRESAERVAVAAKHTRQLSSLPRNLNRRGWSMPAEMLNRRLSKTFLGRGTL